MSVKRRVDFELVERGLAATLSRAQALILAGVVFTGERRILKAGEAVAEGLPLEVRGPSHPWVSRGGLKLVAGLEAFAIDPTGLVGLDIGASTGGFTDVLLACHAARVYAVDVGHGQLAWKLRRDSRVIVLERTNARTLSQVEIPELVDLVVCDASFIGLEVVLPAALALTAPGGRLIALVKPQFEVERDQVGKGGIVRDQALHRKVCDRAVAWLEARPGWRVLGVTESPLRGAGGNTEFLLGGYRCE
ncbi:MAG: TlyA family RNA methyltransferase [Rhodospirillaceae bacterium]